MGTPVEDVYRKFLGMIEDEEWLLVENEVIEDLMLNYLENATVDFTECSKDLTIDYNSMCFNENLNLDETVILSLAMARHYLIPKILREENLRQFVSDKDFNKLSNANMLMRLQGLLKHFTNEFETMQNKYSYKMFKGWN